MPLSLTPDPSSVSHASEVALTIVSILEARITKPIAASHAINQTDRPLTCSLTKQTLVVLVVDGSALVAWPIRCTLSLVAADPKKPRLLILPAVPIELTYLAPTAPPNRELSRISRSGNLAHTVLSPLADIPKLNGKWIIRAMLRTTILPLPLLMDFSPHRSLVTAYMRQTSLTGEAATPPTRLRRTPLLLRNPPPLSPMTSGTNAMA